MKSQTSGRRQKLQQQIVKRRSCMFAKVLAKFRQPNAYTACDFVYYDFNFRLPHCSPETFANHRKVETFSFDASIQHIYTVPW